MPTLDYRTNPAEGDRQRMGVLRHNAEWEATFADSDAEEPQNNLASRRNRNQREHRELYAEGLQEQAAESQRQQILTNKVAQDFFFRGQKLEMDREAAGWALEERQQKMDFERQKLGPELEAKRAAASNSRNMEALRIKQDGIKEAATTKRLEHTTGFQDYIGEMFAKGVMPNTPEYAYGVMEARQMFPATDPVFFEDMYKTTGAKMTAEQAIAFFDENKERNITVSGGGVTLRPEKDQTPFLQSRLDKAKARFATAEKDASAERMQMALEDIAEYEAALGSAKPAASAPPASGEKVSVVSPDGKPGRIPKSQLDAALAAGYKAK